MSAVQRLVGDPDCLHWNAWNLTALQRALALTPGRRAVVQAGGNLGVFAFELAAIFERVYTFEPHPRLFPLMTANAPEENITRLQVALSDKTGMVDIVMPDAPHHDGEGFMTEGDTALCIPLDALWLPACDLLYLDVEGAELLALKGAEGTILRCKPVIAVEMNKCCERFGYQHADLDAWITTRGYRFAEKVQADSLYVPC